MSAGLTSGDFFAMFEGAIRKILREEIQAALHPSDEWRDQNPKNSPLGPRRHCAAVRRRLERNEPGARRVGDRYLLSTDAIAEELERIGLKASVRKVTPPAPLTPEDEAIERLTRRLQRGV